MKKIFLVIYFYIERTKIKKFFSFSVILIVCHLENLKTIVCLFFKVIQKRTVLYNRQKRSNHNHIRSKLSRRDNNFYLFVLPSNSKNWAKLINFNSKGMKNILLSSLQFLKCSLTSLALI